MSGTSVETVDRDWAHLYPAFRTKLQAVLHRVEILTGRKWIMIEGFRSQARQDWLYAQGRTRSGPIVTWIRSPEWHGTGLAADCAPLDSAGRVDYGAPQSVWDHYHRTGLEMGLSNPAFAKGDLGHLQLTSIKTRLLALVWVKRGFK